MRIYTRFFISSFLALVASSALAQTLDLTSAYKLAVENDAQLHAAYNQLLASKEVKPQALADLLPSISASANTNDVRQETESGFSGVGKSTSQFRDEGFSVSLRQPLFNWASFVRYNQASRQVSQAETTYRLANQSLILRLTERYLNVLQSDVNLGLANSDLKAFEQQLLQAKTRFDVGSIAITDVHDAQSRYDLSVATQIIAQDKLDSNQESLRETIQTDDFLLAPLTRHLAVVPPEPNNMQAWEQTASEQNLSLVIARHDVAIAKKEVDINRSGHYPTVDIVASHKYSETGGGSFGTGFRNESDRIGLELNLSLFEGGKTQSLTKQAAFNHQKTLDELQSLQRTTLRETRDFFRGVNSSVKRINALEQAIVSSQSSLEASQVGLDVGTRTIIDVLDAQSNLSRAKLQLIEAKKNYILNVINLKAMTGSLSEKDIEQINQWLQP